MRPASTLRLVPFALLLGVAAQSLAQGVPPLKPGLWELHGTRTENGKTVSTVLPLALRTQLEPTKTAGIGYSPDGAPRICLTPETMDSIRSELAIGCKTDYSTRTAAAWKWKTVCAKPSLEIEGQATFVSPEAYTVSTSTTSSMPNSAARTTKTESKGKWLAASCGDLKPIGALR